jgi:tRNA 2-thiouridine synthesizing protein A
MSSEYETTETLDVKGMNCPMPVVQTKQAIDELDPGAVLEVLATDPGSMSDIEGWANSTDDVELLDQVEEESNSETIYRHYIRRAAE